MDSAALGLGFDSSGRDDKDGAGISDDDERSMPSLTAGSPKRRRLFCKTPPSSTVYGDSPTRALSSSSSQSSDVDSERSLDSKLSVELSRFGCFPDQRFSHEHSSSGFHFTVFEIYWYHTGIWWLIDSFSISFLSFCCEDSSIDNC